MNPLLQVLVASIVFVGAFVVLSFVYWGVQARKEEQQRELARRLGQLSGDPGNTLFRTQVKDELADALGNLGRTLDEHIQQANVEYTVSGLLVRMAGFAAIGVMVGAVIFQSLVALIGLAAGFVPYAILVSKSNERASQISAQLPDALDLMARSLRAGHGLSDAMRMCAEECPMPIAMEFGRVYEEHNLGRDLRDALYNMIRRNPQNFDMRIFVSSTLLQRDTGGNMIEILQNISKTIRDRFIFRGKVKALTAEARFSAYILGGLPFAVTAAIVALRPDYLDPLIQDSLGHIFLGIVAGLFSTGIFVMRKVSQVEL
ncbi:type II secretion system F family protein [Myxococcota bacterium]|nr:type II secretion system F family protein [Myxococcota bacterium]